MALSHYCCRTTLQCQRHETVLKLSFDRVRQPKQYSLQFAAEGEQGRHVPDMTRQRIPGSCCSRRKRAVTQCRTASCRHQQSRRVSRSEMCMQRLQCRVLVNVAGMLSEISYSSLLATRDCMGVSPYRGRNSHGGHLTYDRTGRRVEGAAAVCWCACMACVEIQTNIDVYMGRLCRGQSLCVARIQTAPLGLDCLAFSSQTWRPVAQHAMTVPFRGSSALQLYMQRSSQLSILRYIVLSVAEVSRLIAGEFSDSLVMFTIWFWQHFAVAILSTGVWRCCRSWLT